MTSNTSKELGCLTILIDQWNYYVSTVMREIYCALPTALEFTAQSKTKCELCNFLNNNTLIMANALEPM